jgi:hypothetical protein
LVREFEELCELLFDAEGYNRVKPSERATPSTPIQSPDLLLLHRESRGLAVAEVKLYRSTVISVSLLRNSLNQVQTYQKLYNASEGFLIMSVPIEPRRIRQAAVESGVTVWDLKKLTSIAARDPTLGELLSDFIRRASIGVLSSTSRALTANESLSLSPEIEAKHRIGGQLIQTLENCPPGKAASTEFERACGAALQYLFGEEFAMWKPQNQVEEGFHRIDLLARLAPRHQFWQGLARDFKTRYVVFEFKNYSEPLPQNQIYTTEKYLFPAALRSVAILVARAGIDGGARHAIKGALRESGKLMIWITLPELTAMLKDKDAGNDPHNLLFDRVDELLVDLAR